MLWMKLGASWLRPVTSLIFCLYVWRLFKSDLEFSLSPNVSIGCPRTSILQEWNKYIHSGRVPWENGLIQNRQENLLTCYDLLSDQIRTTVAVIQSVTKSVCMYVEEPMSAQNLYHMVIQDLNPCSMGLLAGL